MRRVMASLHVPLCDILATVSARDVPEQRTISQQFQ
jgi:hypothetical protein